MGLVRILIFAGLGLLAYSLYRRFLSSVRGGENPTMRDERLGRLVQDPQCGVWVDNKEAVRREVAGGELFFCSKECASEYLEEPPAGGKPKPDDSGSSGGQDQGETPGQ